MTCLDHRWLENEEWLDFDEENLEYKPKKDAPEEVWESYRNYQKQLKEAEKRQSV